MSLHVVKVNFADCVKRLRSRYRGMILIRVEDPRERIMTGSIEALSRSMIIAIKY